MKPQSFIEQKPRIVFSHHLSAKKDGGWICFFFEGACTHKSFDEALECVKSYYAADRLVYAEPLTTGIQ